MKTFVSFQKKRQENPVSFLLTLKKMLRIFLYFLHSRKCYAFSFVKDDSSLRSYHHLLLCFSLALLTLKKMLRIFLYFLHSRKCYAFSFVKDDSSLRSCHHLLLCFSCTSYTQENAAHFLSLKKPASDEAVHPPLRGVCQ